MTFPTQSQFTSGLHVLGGFQDEHGSCHRDPAAVSPKQPQGSRIVATRLFHHRNQPTLSSSRSFPSFPILTHPPQGGRARSTIPYKPQPSSFLSSSDQGNRGTARSENVGTTANLPSKTDAKHSRYRAGECRTSLSLSPLFTRHWTHTHSRISLKIPLLCIPNFRADPSMDTPASHDAPAAISSFLPSSRL